LSISTGCFVSSDMRWPTTRAMMSFGPPAGNGTISRIGLLGKSCAAAKAGHSSTDSAAASAPNTLMNASRLTPLSRMRASAWQPVEHLLKIQC
jgi:hypothetical protein